MTIITFDAEFPGSIDMSHGLVKVELDTGALGPGFHEGVELLGVRKFNLNSAGEGQIDLPPNDDIEPAGSVWVVDVEGYEVRLTVPTGGGPFSWGHPDIQAPPGAAPVRYTPPHLIDADVYGVGVPGGLATYDRLQQLATGAAIDPRFEFGAVGDGITDDSVALQAAIDEAVASRRPIMLTGEYSHSDTLVWVPDGPLTVLAFGAQITYTGSGWQWELDMDPGASTLPGPVFCGGDYVRTSSALGNFSMRDVRNALFVGVECICATNVGTAWRHGIEGRWGERCTWIDCSARNYEHAIHFDLEEVAITHKATASGVATITAPGHPFLTGDRVQVVLDTPDADYDTTNAVITGATSTTFTFATSGGDEATTAATGTVLAKGSFARTYVQNFKLQGGVADEAAIECHLRAGPYDSFLDVRGNAMGGSIVFGLPNGAMGGSVIDATGVEVMSSGVVYLFRPAPDPTGRRPILRGVPRLTSPDIVFDEGGVTLYYGTPPEDSPFYPHVLYGGVDTPDYVKAELGLVNRRHTAASKPSIADWPGVNPEFGTQEVQDYEPEGRFGLWVRTEDGMRVATLDPEITFWSDDPTTMTGTFVKGQTCRHPNPDPGEVDKWRCTTGGVDGAAVWTAVASLVP